MSPESTSVSPRTSCSQLANGCDTNGDSSKPSTTKTFSSDVEHHQLDGVTLQTNTNTSPRHTRNRSSVDGRKYKDGIWNPQNEMVLMGPYDYMSRHPGKDIRRQLINAFNAWLKVPPESLAVITKVVGMLHTASLL